MAKTFSGSAGVSPASAKRSVGLWQSRPTPSSALDTGCVGVFEDPDVIQVGGGSVRINPTWFVQDSVGNVHYRRDSGPWFKKTATINPRFLLSDYLFDLENGKRWPRDLRGSSKLYSAFQPLSADRVCMSCFSAGYYFTFLVSTDFGKTYLSYTHPCLFSFIWTVLELASGRLVTGASKSVPPNIQACAFVSDDGGVTWSDKLIAGPTPTPGGANVEVLFLRADGVVFALCAKTGGNFISSSTDNGETWSHVGASDFFSILGIAHIGESIYTGVYGLFLSSGRALFFHPGYAFGRTPEIAQPTLMTSDDNGLTWTNRNGAGTPQGLAVVGDLLYRIKSGSNIIEQSANGGNSWLDFDTVETLTSGYGTALAAFGQRFQ